MASTDIRSLKFSILAFLHKRGKFNKFDMLGRQTQSGYLEHDIGAEFGKDERNLAYRAFDELRRDGLIVPTYSDLTDPENWVVLSEAGKKAFERGALDDLDAALAEVSLHLLELRAGAWAAVHSEQPDALRQAAHSGRELITQALKMLAPDDEVRSEPGFQPDKSSSSRITRRHRVKYIMRKRRGRVSDSDLAVVEKAGDLVNAISDKITGLAHQPEAIEKSDVLDALNAAEIVLRRILST